MTSLAAIGIFDLGTLGSAGSGEEHEEGAILAEVLRCVTLGLRLWRLDKELKILHSIPHTTRNLQGTSFSDPPPPHKSHNLHVPCFCPLLIPKIILSNCGIQLGPQSQINPTKPKKSIYTHSNKATEIPNSMPFHTLPPVEYIHAAVVRYCIATQASPKMPALTYWDLWGSSI
jgi:hypothetical protein